MLVVQSGFAKMATLVVDSPALTTDGSGTLGVWMFIVQSNSGLLAPINKLRDFMIEMTLGKKGWIKAEKKHDKRRQKVSEELMKESLSESDPGVEIDPNDKRARFASLC